MSLLPRFVSHELRPFFRLLEEPIFSAPAFAGSNLSRRGVFQPNFDVREEKDAYILDGEVPGVADKSNLDIHFANANTLVIKGRVEQSRSSGTAPSEASSTAEAPTTADASSSSSSAEAAAKPPRPTVEDEGTEGTNAVVKTAESTVEVAKPEKESKSRYWVSERMVGEFQRSFSFPNSVDQDAVKASLKDGILSIVVPKRESSIGRRINVD